MMEKDLVTKCIHYALNVDYEKFREDLMEILDSRFVVEQYEQEKFDQMRGDFGRFWCSLDEGAKSRFVAVVKQHYGVA